jgi:hypothetical protein
MHSYRTVLFNGLFPYMYTCGNPDLQLKTGLSCNINLFVEGISHWFWKYFNNVVLFVS